MNKQLSPAGRDDAVRRARDHSPFLRYALEARSDIMDSFMANGALAAAKLAVALTHDGVDQRLRRQRYGLALAVALGDLSGELTLEQVTGLLSDFADRAIDEGVEAAIGQSVPGSEPQGFANFGPAH